MPAYERDPLSVRYDAMAARFLARAAARPGRWVFEDVKRPTPGPRTAAWLREHGIMLSGADSGGLAAHERAFQRSLYWVHNGGGGGARNPGWSLQREWGPVTARGGRLLGIRLSEVAAARTAVAGKPKSEQWWRNEAEQSGGLGSPKARFG